MFYSKHIYIYIKHLYDKPNHIPRDEPGTTKVVRGVLGTIVHFLLSTNTRNKKKIPKPDHTSKSHP